MGEVVTGIHLGEEGLFSQETCLIFCLYLTGLVSVHARCQVTLLPDFHMGEFCVPLAVNFIILL